MSQPTDANSGPADRPSNGPSTDPATEAATWNSPLFDGSMPQQIGPYHIISRIGEGGIGSVYKAEQRENVRRVVALKIIKLGMDTREVVARFSAERQALAMMDHPNVARVYDAGSTPTGRPYFVMELVAGEPITDYCDRHSLSVRQRLELFVQVCGAVQHAHQKGIIHRDLKPSNILVAVKEGLPLAKVIDFGIAKAISSRLTDNTLYTEQGQLIGTPEYMSPEQAEMNATDIDTRSDIYSLGVMLYELLAGAPPMDSKTLRAAAYGEIQRMIREVEPPSPSLLVTRLASDTGTKVAERRRLTPPTLAAELKRELEWIPMKAMRKDRTERYQTATELANDIHNYLAGLPLSAGPVSNLYRAKKFVRRNKLVVAAATGFVLLLAIVTTVSLELLIVQQRTRKVEEDMKQAIAQREESNRMASEADRKRAEADRKSAEADQKRVEAERKSDAAVESARTMVQQVRDLKMTPEERSRMLGAIMAAAISKDPSVLAQIFSNPTDKNHSSASAPTSMPARSR